MWLSQVEVTWGSFLLWPLLSWWSGLCPVHQTSSYLQTFISKKSEGNLVPVSLGTTTPCATYIYHDWSLWLSDLMHLCQVAIAFIKWTLNLNLFFLDPSFTWAQSQLESFGKLSQHADSWPLLGTFYMKTWILFLNPYWWLLLIKAYVCVLVWVFVHHVHSSGLRCQKKALNPGNWI